MKSLLFEKYANSANRASKSFNLRKKRFNRFLELLRPNTFSKILDVGGTEAIWLGTDLEHQVTLLNIGFKTKKNSLFNYVVGNACNMDFHDQEFDIIFSNSVIEHVGNFERQKMFANEVRRVGKQYWIQTPYKHFPIEPHFVFPFFQYLPEKMQKTVGLNWKQSHFKMENDDDEKILDELSRLRLLNNKEMKYLFNDGIIVKEKYLGFIKSLIAIRK